MCERRALTEHERVLPAGPVLLERLPQRRAAQRKAVLCGDLERAALEPQDEPGLDTERVRLGRRVDDEVLELDVGMSCCVA